MQTMYFRIETRNGKWIWLHSRGKVISKNSKKFSIVFTHCPVRYLFIVRRHSPDVSSTHQKKKYYKIIKIYLLSIKGKKTVHFYSKKRRSVSDTPLVTYSSSSRMDTTAAVVIGQTLRAIMKTFMVCRKSATSARHTWGSPRMCRFHFIRLWSRVLPVGTCSPIAIPQSCRQRM